MQIWPGWYLSISSMSMIADSGMSSTFSSRPSRTFFFMLKPSVAILRPSAIAAVAICWMRCRWLAKLAVTMRRSRCAANSPVSTEPTLVSLGEYPASSALVESAISRRMPGSFASWPMRARSVRRESTGVRSIL